MMMMMSPGMKLWRLVGLLAYQPRDNRRVGCSMGVMSRRLYGTCLVLGKTNGVRRVVKVVTGPAFNTREMKFRKCENIPACAKTHNNVISNIPACVLE